MELRSAEQHVHNILGLYRALRNSTTVDPRLAGLPEVMNVMVVSDPDVSSTMQSLEQVVETLDQIKFKVIDLEPKMYKFRKRLSETDPITGAPRYGGSTMKRVLLLLQTHDAIQEALNVVFGESETVVVEDSGGGVIQELKGTLHAQREAKRQAALEAHIAQESQRRKEQEEKQAQINEELQILEEARRQRERELEELATAAEASRLARQRAEQDQQRQREERERFDREWESNITKGEHGVREYLTLLRTSTSEEEFKIAVKALQTLYSQIVSKPEETQFRRVRRDHPKFAKDIGRHPGGKEVLIASGFRLGKVDEVPCYLSTEPNLEKDIDAWGDWFELKKKSLKIMEEAMIK